MITIIKPNAVPLTLRRTGYQENILNQQAYDANPLAYRKGTEEFDIKSSIYGYKTIKEKLREAQCNKCCFCEKEQLDEYGAVEHYRPKGGYYLIKTNSIVKPGYYWLSYDWKNLYFVCSACNTAKANYFPLLNERKRAKSHSHNITLEVPLLIDPAGPMNPQEHITFDFQFVRSISKYGAATVQICALNRPALDEKRKILIEIIKAYIAIYQASLSEIITLELKQEAENFLRQCQTASGEFSSAAIAYIKRRNVQV